MSRVGLVTTNSRWEDVEVLDRLQATAADGHVVVAPVPRALVPELVRIAAMHGIAIEDAPLEEGRLRYDDEYAGPEVIAVGDVDPLDVALAAAASPRSGDRDSALVLFDGVSTGALLDQLSALAHDHRPFGVITADGSRAGRLALLKSLFFDRVVIDGVDTLESLSPVPRHRILVVNGHGNAVDVGSVTAGVLCSRSGGEESPAAAYPCFHDGRCFRQPLFGREPSSATGLRDATALAHPIVLLLGCGTMPLGGAVAHASTIVGGMRSSGVLGGVAVGGILYHDATVEEALLTFLLDGEPLGVAVQKFNAWHRDVYGHTSADPAHGPLIAFGNPALRVLRGTRSGPLDPPTRPEVFDVEPRRSEAAMLRDSAPMFAFWKTFLADFVSRAAIDTDLLEALRVREETESSIFRYLAADPFAAGGIVPSGERLLLHDGALGLWQRWQGEMLSAAKRHILRRGGFTFHVWQPLYRRLREAQEARRCPTCARPVAAIRYTSPASSDDVHDLVQCFGCGVLGELPRGLGVAFAAPPELECGTRAPVVVEIENVRDTAVSVQAVLLRECWFHQSPDESETVDVLIAPGERRAIEFPLPLAPALPAGVYPLTLLAVANGGLVHLRHHIRIRRNP